MKLRTFLISSAFAVIGLVLLVFSVQTGDVFRRASELISQTQNRQLGAIVSSSVESHFSVLRSFDRVLRTDNDLAGAFVLAEETRDFQNVREKLLRIRKNIGLDIAEIASSKSGWTSLIDGESAQQLLARGLLKQEGIAALSVGKRSALVYFSPVELYGTTAGVLVIGYFLDGPIQAELADLTRSNLSMAVLNSVSESAEIQDSASSTIPINDRQSISLHLTPKERIGSDIGAKIQKHMLIAGAVSLALLILIFYFVLEFTFVRKYSQLVQEANQLVSQVDQGVEPKITGVSSWITESHTLSQMLLKLASSIQNYQTKIAEKTTAEEEAKREKALAEQARQVGHNIGSPLTALELALSDLSDMPESKRGIVRGALHTIRDISNVLTKRTKLPHEKTGSITAPPRSKEVSSVQLISHLIDVLITEKRMEYRARSGVEIIAPLDAITYGLFANIQPTEFKCVLSNLINNAVESLDENDGRVIVSTRLLNGATQVRVQDTGKGIPAELLPKLGQSGVTFGKRNGSGLGLHHARTSVESWGGQLSIESKPLQGTTITLSFPTVPQPSWFVPDLVIAPGTNIIVLDDDPSIHRVWDARFSEPNGGTLLTPLHFSTGDELRAWARDNSDARAIFLIDYELIGQAKNGLDLIEELQISEHSILVSSGFDEAAVFNRARWLGVRMIPKGLARLVPITTS